MTNRFVIRLLIGILFFSTSLSLYAQSGWDLILANDNKSARLAFEKTLQKDSIDAAAIKGMLFLSEIEGDTQGYYTYLNRLMRHHFNEYYYDVFQYQLDDISPEKLKKYNLSSRFYVNPALFKAYNQFRRREFEESKNSFSKIHNNLHFSKIGGFMNSNGYGYTIEFPVEKEAYNPASVYTNLYAQELSWLMPATYERDGDIILSNYSEGVHYINSFFTSTEEQAVQLRLTRRYPIKVWLDGDMIYESDKQVSPHYDAELMSFTLPKGNHRLFIKYAIGNYYQGKSGSSELDFDGMKSTYLGYEYVLEDNDDKKISTIERLESYENNYNPYHQNNLLVRITDKNGIAIPLQSSKEPLSYSQNDYQPTLTTFETLDYFNKLLKKDNPDAFDYYMLLQAHAQYDMSATQEEFFARLAEQNPTSAYFLYLAAKSYNENNKTEKSFDLLGEFDEEKTPVFALLYKELEDIDAENQSEEYEEALETLSSISRSNFKVISKKLEFYDQKGRKDERIAYAKKMAQAFPSYAKALKRYIDDKDNKPSDYFEKNKEDEDKALEKDYKKALKKYYDVNTYKSLIKLYKKDKQVEKVLALYDEMAAIEPYDTWILHEKGTYLYSKERYDEALVILKKGIALDPNNSDFYESIGDIYSDKGDKNTALAYYKQAQKRSSGNRYGGRGLNEKIEKIEGEKQYKNKFDTPSFEQFKSNYEKATTLKYEDAESVILGFSRDVIWNDTTQSAHLYSNIMIKILTESGAKLWTQYNFDLLGYVTSAKVVRENGSETRPDVQGSFVVFKNLKVGDVIQIEGIASWNTVSELGNLFGISTYFPFPAPVHYAKIEFLIPQKQQLYYDNHKLKAQPIITEREDGLKSYRWEYKGIPIPIQEEASVDNLEMYPVLSVCTTNDYSLLVDWYKAKTYKKLESNYIIDDILKEIIKEGMTDEQKIEAVFNYISTTINYSHTDLLQSGYIPKDSDLTCSSKIGDCKDVATIMITMLRQLGIDSYYVLVKVNENTQHFTPLEVEFNHAIVAYYLNGKVHFSDPTTDFYPYYSLNEGDTEAWALLIKDGENNIFRLPATHLDSTKTFVTYDVDAKLDEINTLNLDIKTTYKGLIAGRWRSIINQDSKDNLPNHIISSLGSNSFRNIELDDHSFEQVENISAPLVANYKLHTRSFTDDVTGIYFMRLPFVKTVEPHVAIYSSERSNTMDVQQITFAQPHLQRIHVKMNTKFAVKRLPQNIDFKHKYGTYKLTLKTTKEGLYIERFVQFNQTYIPPSEFKAFKEFYLQLLEFDNLKVLLQQL